MTHALIVDDTFANQDVLEEILSDYGITSMAVASIDEARAATTSHTFDVVLMDMAIPQSRFGAPEMLGGVEATRQIIAELGDESPPFIAVTAQGMPESHPKILAAGISQIVEKSIDLEQRIVRALEDVLGRSLSKQGLPMPSSGVAPTVAVEARHRRLGAPNISRHQPVATVTRQSNIQPASSSDIPVKVEEPSSVWELRHRVRAELEEAAVLLDQLSEEFGDTGREANHRQLVQSLRHNLAEASRRLNSADDGPRPDEPYGHWIVNLLLGIAREANKLLSAEQQEHFGKCEDVFATVKQHVDRAILLGKSPAGHRRAEAPEQPAMQPCRHETACPTMIHAGDVIANSPLAEAGPPSDVLEPIWQIPLTPEKRLILIVDDEPEPRRDLEEKLKRLNYRVISCDSSSTALVFLESQRFDVCLIDLIMPEIDGLQLIERIRQSSMSANASIIVVSGQSESFVAAEAIEKGADDYLEKPADERLLKARIQSCLRQSDARLSELCKFLPFDVVHRVLHNRELLEKPMPADITVMVCDVRGFSRISERVGPVRTIEWISDIMNRLSRMILHRGGTIIDYVGDEIMAMWGAPIASQSHANDACQCALAVQQAADVLSEKWFPVIGSKLAIGIGINSGLAVVGNTGSKHRIKYGPLGNTVNMASRVQGATKYLQSSILMTEDTATRVDNNLKGRRICAVRVQNINEPVRLFELAANVSEEIRSRNLLYQQALECFENEKLPDALALTAKLLTESPNDGPAKLLMMRIIQCQLGGSFDPVWTLPGK